MAVTRHLIFAGSAVVLIVVGAFVWILLTRVLGIVYLPSGSETVGNFTIKAYRTEGFGHTGTRQTLYFRGNKIGEYLNGLVPSPQDPDRALYARWCADGIPSPECGLFYFDGHKQRSYRIDPDPNVSLVALYPEYAEEKLRPWSADGHFVTIQDQYKLLLVDLETGEHTDFAERLDAQSKQQPMPPTRTVHFAGWSPDTREAAVLLSTEADPRPPVTHFVTDVYTVELPALQLTYHCTFGPYDFTEVQGRWQQDAGGYRFQLTFKRTDVPSYHKETHRPCS